jgi:hypothetical protein
MLIQIHEYAAVPFTFELHFVGYSKWRPREGAPTTTRSIPQRTPPTLLDQQVLFHSLQLTQPLEHLPRSLITYLELLINTHFNLSTLASPLHHSLNLPLSLHSLSFHLSFSHLFLKISYFSTTRATLDCSSTATLLKHRFSGEDRQYSSLSERHSVRS